MKLSREQYKDLYCKMVKTRVFEETAVRLFEENIAQGTAHFCIGEEAAAVGVCSALEKEDMITQTHRGHGQAIGKGADVNRMMAELLGKETGCCRGMGGSMHIADFSTGSLGANGIVGAGIPIAVGAALAQKYFKRPNITVCFFGDGAANEGAFHESLNLASVWQLPVLFVCTNNFYGISTHISRSMHIDDISVRASSYGIEGVNLDGNDVIAVFEETVKARKKVLEKGPMFMVLTTYRWLGHSRSDAQVYRTTEEVDRWKEKCPIKHCRERLLSEAVFTPAELDAFEKQVCDEVAAAAVFAETSPEISSAGVFQDVYAPGDIRDAKPKNGFVVCR
ncbi:MAG: thiamine pyrophosphate-dependent dehydrogenase E1 component subunit alpha [Spirochaetaceae bacterium]|jgi:pyruvate dehydrogenase E1 component alpha subunit|nr:thiamine pyrophosphate-dependent dehydrogenase E1 component subunit alpha [Spirochaetaceae bacterium]